MTVNIGQAVTFVLYHYDFPIMILCMRAGTIHTHIAHLIRFQNKWNSAEQNYYNGSANVKVCFAAMDNV